MVRAFEEFPSGFKGAWSLLQHIQDSRRLESWEGFGKRLSTRGSAAPSYVLNSFIFCCYIWMIIEVSNIITWLLVSWLWMNGLSRAFKKSIAWRRLGFHTLFSKPNSMAFTSLEWIVHNIQSFMSLYWSLIENRLSLEECKVHHLVSKSRTTRNTSWIKYWIHGEDGVNWSTLCIGTAMILMNEHENRPKISPVHWKRYKSSINDILINLSHLNDSFSMTLAYPRT